MLGLSRKVELCTLEHIKYMTHVVDGVPDTKIVINILYVQAIHLGAKSLLIENSNNH